METISIENVFDNVPRIGVMIPPGEARERGYANGTWGTGGTPGFPFLSFLLLPSLSSLFSLFSSPSPLSRTRACVRKGMGRFFSSSPLSHVLPLFLSFRKFFSSSALFSSHNGNCFRRKRSFLLPSSAPLSSIFFLLSPSLLSSLFCQGIAGEW